MNFVVIDSAKKDVCILDIKDTNPDIRTFVGSDVLYHHIVGEFIVIAGMHNEDEMADRAFVFIDKGSRVLFGNAVVIPRVEGLLADIDEVRKKVMFPNTSAVEFARAHVEKEYSLN
jgi:hypothetical protein